MNSLKAGSGTAAASDAASNDKEFARFAKKAKVPQALVKAAFTGHGMNKPDGTFAFHTSDITKLKDYVSSKMTNRVLPEHEVQLSKVLHAIAGSVQAHANAVQANLFAPSRAPQAAGRANAAPVPPPPAAAGRAQPRVSDPALKAILLTIPPADRAREKMLGETDRGACRRAQAEARTQYREASSALSAYVRGAEPGPNRDAARQHRLRVFNAIREVNGHVLP